jgi:hypothetical protein
VFHREPTIEAAMEGFPFNLDRAAVDVTSCQVFEGGLIRGIEEKLIRFDAVDRYLEHVQAMRAVLLLRKTSYGLDESVVALFRSRSWAGRQGEIESYLQSDGWTSAQIEHLFAEMERYATTFAA